MHRRRSSPDRCACAIDNNFTQVEVNVYVWECHVYAHVIINEHSFQNTVAPRTYNGHNERFAPLVTWRSMEMEWLYISHSIHTPTYSFAYTLRVFIGLSHHLQPRVLMSLKRTPYLIDHPRTTSSDRSATATTLPGSKPLTHHATKQRHLFLTSFHPKYTFSQPQHRPWTLAWIKSSAWRTYIYIYTYIFANLMGEFGAHEGERACSSDYVRAFMFHIRIPFTGYIFNKVTSATSAHQPWLYVSISIHHIFGSFTSSSTFIHQRGR